MFDLHSVSEPFLAQSIDFFSSRKEKITRQNLDFLIHTKNPEILQALCRHSPLLDSDSQELILERCLEIPAAAHLDFFSFSCKNQKILKSVLNLFSADPQNPYIQKLFLLFKNSNLLPLSFLEFLAKSHNISHKSLCVHLLAGRTEDFVLPLLKLLSRDAHPKIACFSRALLWNFSYTDWEECLDQKKYFCYLFDSSQFLKSNQKLEDLVFKAITEQLSPLETIQISLCLLHLGGEESVLYLMERSVQTKDFLHDFFLFLACEVSKKSGFRIPNILLDSMQNTAIEKRYNGFSPLKIPNLSTVFSFFS